MDSIPIPTDNIYKFCALFGLALFIFGVSIGVYVTNSDNAVAFQAIADIATVKQDSHPSLAEQATEKIAETKLDLIKQNKTPIFYASVAIETLSLLLMFFGFRRWYKVVQPVQDEIAQLQLEKLRYEVGQLKPATPPAGQKHSHAKSRG